MKVRLLSTALKLLLLIQHSEGEAWKPIEYCNAVARFELQRSQGSAVWQLQSSECYYTCLHRQTTYRALDKGWWRDWPSETLMMSKSATYPWVIWTIFCLKQLQNNLQNRSETSIWAQAPVVTEVWESRTRSQFCRISWVLWSKKQRQWKWHMQNY